MTWFEHTSGTLIKHFLPLFLFFFISIQHAPWSNLTYCETLQCRLLWFKCLLAGQDEVCIINNKGGGSDRQWTDKRTALCSQTSKNARRVFSDALWHLLSFTASRPPLLWASYGTKIDVWGSWGRVAAYWEAGSVCRCGETWIQPRNVDEESSGCK